MCFLNIIVCYYFSLEMVLQGMAKNNPTKNRNGNQKYSVRKGVFRYFAKFTRKHLSQSRFFNKVTCLSLQLYQKRDSDKGVFL